MTHHARRGSTATYVALALPVIGGFGALGIEYAYLRHVQIQLDGVSSAAAHAAMVELDQLDAHDTGLGPAREMSVAVVEGSIVDRHPYSLDPGNVIFGYYDAGEGSFEPTQNIEEVNAVRVPLAVHGVGLGFGQAFFGRNHSVFSCSAVAMGEGNASTGDMGGPGIANGHFDYDTTDPRWQCTGASVCNGTSRHTHEFDDSHDTTFADQRSDLDGHLPITGCTDGRGKIGACGGAFTRTIPDGVAFKIVVVNADLSPGAWITINGTDYDVDYYDDIPLADLPTFQLGPGLNELDDLSMNFDVDAIANCELIPTNTGDVRANTPGIYGEWRSGALTVQLVTPVAVSTPGISGGDQDAVVSQANGLLYEATFFWHWDGPSYIQAQAEQWQEQYDALDCRRVQFIEHAPGGSACP